MAKAANILHSLVPISQFNKGKAAQIFDRLRTEKELVVLKNNQPSAVILSPEEYTRLTEIEEDYMLLIEANSRLEANGDKPAISFTNVLNDLGISEADLEHVEEVDIE
ncbi:MAG TPA: type II toxin-antitoxin system Phd/YefM family antitoxin [Candidatus Scatomonas merdavium]|nr:type II toxin-antitoxin system Phd/YefM family antitoxin [Candidatus Scatomonas merdavium]